MRSMYELLINLNDNFSDYSIKQQLMLLFVRNRGKYYRDQQEVMDDLEKMGAPHSQGAISKNLRFLQQFPFGYKGNVYAICQTPKGYTLLDQTDYPKSLRYVLDKEKLLKRDSVFYEHANSLPQMFVFWIVDDEEKRERAKELFKRVLNGNYMDIFFVDDKLVIFLDAESEFLSQNSRILRNLFLETNDMYLRMD